ncbi:MAG: mandelate racemase/muconate lactonizing enzyme family protein [Planctomycetaceae bacterium]
MKITRIEVRTVAPQVQRFTWSFDLPEQFMTNTVVRIETDAGVEGVAGVSNYTSYDFDRYTAETVRHLAPVLLGRDPRERDELYYDLRPRVFPLSPGALAVIDVALWDLAGRIQEKPLYELLGATRTSIPSYASTPLMDDVPAYLELIKQRLAMGFTAVKFHCWCLPEKDLALCRAARETFPDVAFMHDVENNYSHDDALRVAHELAELNFTWFEAPFPDWDLDGYRQLTSQVDVPIIPSGNWLMDLQAFKRALDSDAWTRARTDITCLGGLTPAREALQICEAAGRKCEVLGWGNTLISAANLHLMLSNDCCSYFEQSVPYEPYEYGMLDVIRTNPDGKVTAPDGPGLGVGVDWDAMDAATVHRLAFD